MARAARPKLTTYGALASGMAGFSVHPEEEDYFQQGEGIIRVMHYQAETQTLDVTTWADPGIYIAPREVRKSAVFASTNSSTAASRLPKCVLFF